MAHSISNKDRIFFRGVVDEAVKTGLIRKPLGWESSTVTNIRVNTRCCCCIPCCLPSIRVSDERKTGVIVAVVLFVFAFFVGLYYTAQSIRSVRQAQADLYDVRRKISEFPSPQPNPNQDYQPFNPNAVPFVPPVNYGPVPYNPHVPNPHAQLYPSDYSPFVDYPPVEQENPPYNPNSDFSQLNPGQTNQQPLQQPLYPPVYQPMPQQPFYPPIEPIVQYNPLKALYEDAATLINERRKERTFAAFAQGIMTLGAGLVTVALLITAVVEPQLLTIALGAAGAGVAVVGICLWAGKYCCYLNTRAEETARRLIDAMN